MRQLLLLMVLAGAGAACSRAPEDSRAVPAAAPLPRANLTRLDRERWRAVLAWPDACESAFQTSHAADDPGLTFTTLTPGVAIVQVLCAAGAYQPSWVYVQLDERRVPPSASVLRFPVYETEDGTAITSTEQSEVWGEPTWSAAARELSVLNIVRQTGDCGIWTRYRLPSDDTATRPVVVEARALLPCPARPRERAVSADGQPPLDWTPIAPPVPKAR